MIVYSFLESLPTSHKILSHFKVDYTGKNATCLALWGTKAKA